MVAADRDMEGGNEVVEEIQALGHRSVCINLDVSNPAHHESLVKKVMKEDGPLHIAENNAGIAGVMAPLAEYPIDEWHRVIGINLSGVFFGLRFQSPLIMQRGGGSIVNISSIPGKVGTHSASAYTASKDGVVGLTKSAALEYSSQNIRVNAIGPGYIKTPMLLNNLDKAGIEAAVGLHPIGRLGEPEEIAKLALWLNSDDVSFVTGAYYPIDGGYLAQ